jgi:hypothetical protein
MINLTHYSTQHQLAKSLDMPTFHARLVPSIRRTLTRHTVQMVVVRSWYAQMHF